MNPNPDNKLPTHKPINLTANAAGWKDVPHDTTLPKPTDVRKARMNVTADLFYEKVGFASRNLWEDLAKDFMFPDSVRVVGITAGAPVAGQETYDLHLVGYGLPEECGRCPRPDPPPFVTAKYRKEQLGHGRTVDLFVGFQI